MANEIIKIADAVKDFINAQVYSLPVTATRSYRPFYSAADLKNLQVTIVPRHQQQQINTRAGNETIYQIDIGIQKKLASDAITDIDPLMDLTQEIMNSLDRHNILGNNWIESQADPIYSHEHLDKLIFTSLITLNYQGIK